MSQVQTRPTPATFSADQAADIIREATARSLTARASEALTEADVAVMAHELGVDQASLNEAVQAHQAQQRAKQERAASLRALSRHAASYLISLAGLTVLDVMTGPGWWVQWVAFGWGMGIAGHALRTLRAK